ncbi:MAG: phosphatidate cytidylyltransferase [Deltaproteobacteria bacterium]|nr:phosphatidate cytidylyltransferase [Deltaproteobacteria bacterium]
MILAPLVVLLFLEGPSWLKAVVVIVAAGLCLAELFAMAMPERALERWVGVALGVAMLVVLWRSPPTHTFGLMLPMLFVPGLVVVLRPVPIESAALRMFTLWSGIFYIVLPLFAGLELALAPHPWMLYAAAAVFMGDTGAYFAGKALGRHKLHPRVSPNKTWEGAIGGLVGSALGGWLMVVILDLPLTTLSAILFALIGGAIAQVGDLAESLIKRTFGVKDSGTLLPGHGGLLDRIDGLIFALPFFALVLY